MARANQDPLEALIADGRVGPHPVDHYRYPKVITVDLELLAQTLVDRLTDVYLYNSDIRDRYYGTDDEMMSNIIALVDFSVALTYNRLRFILKCYYPTMRTKLMNSRCPVHKSLEFPAWLSSTLSCIGPCRISNGPCDALIVYATTAETMNNYGRRKPVEYVYGHYDHIMTHLRRCKVAMAPLNFEEMKGSFYPTIRPVLNGTWTFYGQVHKSHYESEDIYRIFLVTNSNGVSPFEDIGMTIGFVDDPAVVDAIAAHPPPNLPPGQTADSQGRLVGGIFRVNYFGIKPAVPAQGNKPAQKRGIYVIGRGVDRYFEHSLGNDIVTYEITGVLRDRMTHIEDAA